MHFNSLPNQKILSRIRQAASDERKLTTQVLELLFEVERRLLFAELGYSSLYDFCRKDLGYCDGSAYLRISSMHLLKMLPVEQKTGVEQKIESGELTLRNLTLVKQFIGRNDELTHHKDSNSRPSSIVSDLIQEVSSKSKREAEKILLAKNPDAVLPSLERVRPVSATQTQITFTVKEEFIEKMARVREVRAHVDAQESHAQLFESLMEFYLKHKDPVLKAERSGIRAEKEDLKQKPSKIMQNASDLKQEGFENKKTASPIKTPTFPEKSVTVAAEIKKPQPRFIEAKTKHEVWLRDSGCCAYVSDETGQACHSRFGLELDHVVAFAKGGENTHSNLRLRCRTHNSLYALKTYGKFFSKTG